MSVLRRPHTVRRSPVHSSYLPIVEAACSHGVKDPYRRSTLENRSISSSRTRVFESSP